MKIASLKRLLRPSNIAVIGGFFAEEVIRQCDRIGYEGEIWPVNPFREEMVGRICFSSVEALPQSPDAAFIAVERQKTVDTVAKLAAFGAGGAVCYASGFAELGDEGVTFQNKLVEVMGDMAITGPNCYGILNYLDGVALWPDQHGGKRVEKGVALIMQSGNIGISLTMQQRSLPLAYMISVGNLAGVAFHEYIEALLEDRRVTAIGLHIEGLRDIAAFSQTALKALEKGVPLVVLKSGVSESGRNIALSHTSSLTGADQLYDALFARVGIMRVHTLPQLLESLKFLSVIGPLPGDRIASISCSGGEAGLVADMAESMNLSTPALTETQHKDLHSVLGDKVPLSNPLDYHTYIWGDVEAQYRCFSAMISGTQDITLKILDYPRDDLCDDTAWEQTARAFCRAVNEQGARGAIVSTLPENLPSKARKMILEQGLVPMQGLEECLLSIKGSGRIFDKQQSFRMIQPLMEVPLSQGQVVSMDEAQSKQTLRKYGIPTPRFVVCTRDEAVGAALNIGFPVAVKALSAELMHKSDVNGLHLNVQTPEAVRQALETMKGLSNRFLVEAMAPQPIAELILGLTQDPQFGLALVIGAGGTLVELIRDRATLLFPISREEVDQSLASLKIASLLNGFRGGPPANKAAIVDAVMCLTHFAEENAKEIIEVDLNPLFVLPDGVLAVDASIRMNGANS